MKYKNNETVYFEEDFFLADKTILPILRFAAWDDLSGVKHCFTTRDGGVSEGIFRSLNFRKDAEDDPTNIKENFRRVAEYFETTADRIVCAQQTHTANVRVVTNDDAGKGVTHKRDYTDVDGLVTDVPGLVLFTSHADCVPLYFYDPVKKAVGLAHSGWRGSVGQIGRRTIELMGENYGCDPADIYAAVGPSICADCYEVSEDVASEVRPLVNGLQGEEDRVLKNGRSEGKYQLDLWELNRLVLKNAGIKDEHLTVSNLCTCCNPDKLFSHRATAGKRGNLGAFIMLG